MKRPCDFALKISEKSYFSLSGVCRLRTLDVGGRTVDVLIPRADNAALLLLRVSESRALSYNPYGIREDTINKHAPRVALRAANAILSPDVHVGSQSMYVVSPAGTHVRVMCVMFVYIMARRRL